MEWHHSISDYLLEAAFGVLTLSGSSEVDRSFGVATVLRWYSMQYVDVFQQLSTVAVFLLVPPCTTRNRPPTKRRLASLLLHTSLYSKLRTLAIVTSPDVFATPNAF